MRKCLIVAFRNACFGILFLAASHQSVFAQPFTRVTNSLPTGGCAAWGDYDNDGDLDLLLQSSPYRNNGDQTFSNVPPTYALFAASLAWGDYNNDGYLDFLVTGQNSQSGQFVSRVYRNNGNGTFATNIIAGLPNVGYGSVAWGDIDNDGRLDFILTGGTFSTPKSLSRVYHNNGDGTFTDIAAGLPGVMQSSVAWGDYDNDGYLDILLTGNTGAYGSAVGIAQVYHNNRDGTFTDIVANLLGVSSSSAAWGDFNNDGYLDILVAGQVDSFGNLISRVYLNNQNGTFTDRQAGLPGMVGGSALWGNYDNDGNLDILLSWDGFTRVYRNNTSVPNTPPATPTNLLASILPHNNVVLTWSPSNDNETTNFNGLYYNLRVGTSPGGIQLFSPQADLATGLRRVPSFGNAGHTNQWFLSNLPRGTYYWSVQAIDTAFAGSPFAAEVSFTITNDVDFASNHTPVADPQTISTQEDASVPITLTGSDFDNDPLTFILANIPTNGTLKGIPPNLLYIPKIGCYSGDSFTFRVRDGLTVSTNATITIIISPITDARFISIRQVQLFGGSLEITFKGEPGQSYEIQSSDDLLNWSHLLEFADIQTNRTCDPFYTFYTSIQTNQQFFRAKFLQ